MILIFDLIVSVIVGLLWAGLVLLVGLPFSFAVIIFALTTVTGMLFLPFVQGAHSGDIDG